MVFLQKISILKIQNVGKKIILSLTGLFLVFLFGNACFDYEEAEFLFQTQNKIVLAGLCLFVLCWLLLFFYVVGIWLKKCSQLVQKCICAVIITVIILMQFYFLFHVRSMYLWDGAFVVGGAESLLSDGIITKEAWYYLSSYPNQNTFVLLTCALLKVGHFFHFNMDQNIVLLNGFNMMSLDVAILFSIFIWKKLKKNVAPAQLALILLAIACNPFIYLNVSYYYTMTLSLPYMMAFLYFCICLPDEKRKSRKILFACLSGTCFAFGYLLRATSIIPVLAMFLVLLLFFIKKRTKENSAPSKVVLSYLVALLVGVLLISGLGIVQKKAIGLTTEDTAFPVTHWVMMSLTGVGAHNAEDEAYTASFPTKEEKKEAVKNRIFEKLDAMDVSDFASLMVRKTQNTWGNGSFGSPYLLENVLNTDDLYPLVFGNKKDFFILYEQGYYLFLLLGALASVFLGIRSKNIDWRVFLLQITLLGAFLFYLIWETSHSYAIPFLLVLGLLSLHGYSEITSKYTETIVGEKTTVTNQWLNRLPRIRSIGIVVLVTGVVVFGVKNVAVFTKEKIQSSHPVVSQLMANEPVSVGSEVFEQTFQTKQSFNSLVFQWRNPTGAENDAKYQVTLREESKPDPVFTAIIDLKNTAYNGVFEQQFEQVIPKKQTKYSVFVQKIEGKEGQTIQLVMYHMGKYDPYPNGTAFLNQKELEGDLLLLVTNQSLSSYVSSSKYYFGMIFVVIIFLFLGFCCKLNEVKKKG